MIITDFKNCVARYSMTSHERINYLFNSLEYIRSNNIDGDYVECGVWKGGNIIGIIKYLQHYNNFKNDVWLYDTFSGMPAPEDSDVDLNNQSADSVLHLEHVKALAPLQEVQNNVLKMCGNTYPEDKIHYIIGDVSDTLLIEKNLPNKIALLRLDTDWYKSTKIELEILYERLVSGGVLIIDDYGHWKGCRKAVDEYFSQDFITKNAVTIDYTGIAITKK